MRSRDRKHNFFALYVPVPSCSAVCFREKEICDNESKYRYKNWVRVECRSETMSPLVKLDIAVTDKIGGEKTKIANQKEGSYDSRLQMAMPTLREASLSKQFPMRKNTEESRARRRERVSSVFIYGKNCSLHVARCVLMKACN